MIYLEAQQLTELAERKKQVLLVDHVFVSAGAVRRTRTSIEPGERGVALYCPSVRVNLGLLPQAVNGVWDLGVRDFSIVDYSLAEWPIAVSSVGGRHTNGGGESVAFVTLHLEENPGAHLRADWLTPAMTLLGLRRAPSAPNPK